MKRSRTTLLIAAASAALLLVLVIQVSWIVRTADIKEELFSEKADMVLSRTTEALRADRETCRRIDACAGTEVPTGSTLKLGRDEVRTIDSLLRHYMARYNVQIGYTFGVIKPGLATTGPESGLSGQTYNKPLADETANSIELKLIFPGKKQFIVAEMGPLFITSVILILVVLLLFWQTVRSLLREKRISEHTTDFLNNMTHEFKTPLTNIALAGKMILKDSSLQQSDKVKHYSEIILEENEKLRLQVEQVLSMTALEKGEIPLRKTALDMHALIRETIRHIGIQIENRQGGLHLNLDARSFVVMGDKTHLTNSLSNLIDNALKYSGEKPAITISTYNAGNQLVMVVSDQGIGIGKEYHRKVFDKFFRVPTGDVHDVKGFGLGLSYVKKIVELHGGTIELQSEKGKGTTLTILLPND